MQVSMNLVERMKLFSLISEDPKFKEGNIATWKMIDTAKKALSLSEKEYKDFKIVTKDGVMYAEAKEKAEEEISYTIPDPLYAIIVSFLKEENDKSKITESQYILWKKLVKEEEAA